MPQTSQLKPSGNRVNYEHSNQSFDSGRTRSHNSHANPSATSPATVGSANGGTAVHRSAETGAASGHRPGAAHGATGTAFDGQVAQEPLWKEPLTGVGQVRAVDEARTSCGRDRPH